MEINKEHCKSFGNGRKVIKLSIINLQFSSRNETNKQNNLLTLTVSSEKSCLIRRKKKVKNKWINNTKEINLHLNKKLVRFITHLENTSTTQQTVKNTHKTKQWDI